MEYPRHTFEFIPGTCPEKTTTQPTTPTTTVAPTTTPCECAPTTPCECDCGSDEESYGSSHT
ncbi:hypothetical protein DPMN_081225 [Dreissena polymorpha]|uniref:Uncharacterized protein n=1 Tax=Dreissena polymorpha TaxID=45954 RepID=A0A9D3Y5M0_DREPO|nr:hypothetical protein DPMN_081225 [Dreissena polymorpha]